MAASQHPGPVEGDDGTYVDSLLGKRYATPARMRARALEVPKLETVDEREDYIAMLMVEQVWTPHTSRDCQMVCGEAWGVAMTTVRDYSAAASRKLHARARDDGGMYAAIALRSMTTVAELGCTSDLPGDKNAAVNASEKLLKFAGLAEPEEDKSRPTTLIQVGQVVASPVFSGLLNGSARQLNGKGENGTATNGHAEVADAVPGKGRNKPVV